MPGGATASGGRCAGRPVAAVPLPGVMWGYGSKVVETENDSEFITAAEAFNAPIYKSMEDHPMWKIDPKYEPIKESGKYGHLYGWPAPGDEKSQQVTNSFIIPNMFAKAVTGTSTKDAMLWAEAEIKRIYDG